MIEGRIQCDPNRIYLLNIFFLKRVLNIGSIQEYIAVKKLFFPIDVTMGGILKMKIGKPHSGIFITPKPQHSNLTLQVLLKTIIEF